MKRVSYKDKLSKDKLEVSSYLVYTKKYRAISNDAKWLYLILLKRFSVSEDTHAKYMAKHLDDKTADKFNYIDEYGDLFCLLSNIDLRFWMDQVTEKQIIKWKKELHAVSLLEEVKQTKKRPNRMYVGLIEPNANDKELFDLELTAFKKAEKEKAAEKNSKRKHNAVRKTERKKNLQSSELENLELPKCAVQRTSQNGSSMNFPNGKPSTKESFSTKETKDIKIVNKEDSVDNPNQQSLFDFQNRIDQAKKEREQLKSICLKWALQEHSRFGKAYWEKIIDLFVDDLVRQNCDGSRKIDGVKNAEGYIRRSMSNIANKKFLKSNKHLLFRYTIESYNVHSTSFFFHEVQEQFETEIVPDDWFDVFSEIFLENQLTWQVLNVLVEFTLTYTNDFNREFIGPVVAHLMRKDIRTAEQAIDHFENHQSINL